MSRILILVAGDLGRSPRALYHAQALVAAGASVDLVGEGPTPPPDDLLSRPQVTVHIAGGEAPAPARWTRGRAAGRAIGRTVRLLRAALAAAPPAIVLVQTPPALPALLVARLVARRHRARLIVDWHNFTGAPLTLRVGRDSRLPAVLDAVERWLARRADDHLCVSEAMAERLRRDGITAVVLRDYPAARFVQADARAARAWLMARRAELGFPQPGQSPVVVVSSTSWTPDEDLQLLLDAATELDRRMTARAGSDTPEVWVLVTGRGAGREAFDRRCRARETRHVHVRTAWFAWDEYPTVLAAADLGVSCHWPAAGVDPAMKVADMHGAGLPVCARASDVTRAEQLTEAERALAFSTSGQLADILERLLAVPAATLPALRASLDGLRRPTWEDEWRRVAASRFGLPMSLPDS